MALQNIGSLSYTVSHSETPDFLFALRSMHALQYNRNSIPLVKWKPLHKILLRLSEPNRSDRSTASLMSALVNGAECAVQCGCSTASPCPLRQRPQL